jgi:hypothetical protein
MHACTWSQLHYTDDLAVSDILLWWAGLAWPGLVLPDGRIRYLSLSPGLVRWAAAHYHRMLAFGLSLAALQWARSGVT